MKIFAKQVAPENQESPLFYGDFPENVYIFGNEKYMDHGREKIDDLLISMYDAADELKRLLTGEFADLVNGYSLKEILHDFLKAENGREYSRADRLKWSELLLTFDAAAINDNDAITAALELITGDEYSAAKIRGRCQGDWQRVLYPTKYGREWLKNFECEYFNTGDEWRITENDPDDDDDFYFYTHEWSDDGKRAEIAAAVGCDPADVVLYAFDGWSRTPIYKEI